MQKNGEQISFYEKLDEVEAKAPDFFQRIHNCYLVNMNCISKVESTSCICSGEELPVSRAYKQTLAVAFARTMLN
nr:LytTR family DNA-binding domain-containing protein [uncultured Blautia sp.]